MDIISEQFYKQFLRAAEWQASHGDFKTALGTILKQQVNSSTSGPAGLTRVFSLPLVLFLVDSC